MDNEIPTLKIRMFGKFEILSASQKISVTIEKTPKLKNLVCYLIANRHKVISQQELINKLWENDSSDDPAGALKNLVYRVRKAFEKSNVPGARDFIVFKDGSYSWNNDVKCTVDIEEFEQFLKVFESTEKTNSERMNAGLEILKLYNGDFLPQSAYESWVIPMSTYYHSKYFKCIDAIIPYIFSQNEYDKVYSLTSKAVEIDSLEETPHIYFIKSLLAEKKVAMALSRYNDTTELFYRELGVKLSEKFTELRTEISKAGTIHGNTFDEIIKELDETEEAEGAYFCDIESFKSMYRIEARNAARTGAVLFIGLISIKANEENMSPQKMFSICQELKDVLRFSLRKGDIVAKVAVGQLIMMLPTTSFENAEKVMKRICRNHNSKHKNRDVELAWYLSSLSPKK